MCYNVKALLDSQLKRARLQRNEDAVKEIQLNLFELGLNDLHQVSGFTHPRLLIYPDAQSGPIVATWGLVPAWVKNHEGKLQIWNTTLNARGETIFEKPTFRDAAKSKRCIVYLDGFYEHHHFEGKTYPFFISKKDADPFPVACLWSEWSDKENKSRLITFSMVTTVGNTTMSRIHNNPKLEGPRMPVILNDELADVWLDQTRSQKELSELLLPFDDDLLTAHTVTRILGKVSIGNVPEATQEFVYEELKMSF